jgi:hypothetical protein
MLYLSIRLFVTVNSGRLFDYFFTQLKIVILLSYIGSPASCLLSMKKCVLAMFAGMITLLDHAAAQSDLQDTSFYRSSINQAIALYYQSIGENAHLYNGSEYLQYVVYDPEEIKNPYFMSIFLEKGTLLYDGTFYTNVQLCYDVLRDQLISTRWGQNYRIRLVDDKVVEFTLAGHHFVRLSEDSTHKLPYGTGYYETLYMGKKLQVFAKRQKKQEDKINSMVALTIYTPMDHFIIRKDGAFYPAQTKKLVLEALRDHKKELKKWLRKNKVEFAPHPESGIVQAAQYYEQLTK